MKHLNISQLLAVGGRITGVSSRSKGAMLLSTTHNFVDVFKQRLPKELQVRIGNDFNHPNGFKLFDLEERFKIDEIYLQREMHKLQNLLHPDRFVDQHPEVQAQSNKLSAVVNDFYKILSHPYERGKYLLGLVSKKSDLEIEETLDKLQLNSEFLARMMEISETIHSPESDSRELSKLEYELEEELVKLVNELNEEFAKRNFDDIVKKLGTLKFVANCHKALIDKQCI